MFFVKRIILIGKISRKRGVLDIYSFEIVRKKIIVV